MRDAFGGGQRQSVPWRLLYRVTYSRAVPAAGVDAAIVVPQITPVMAVPVLDVARPISCSRT